MATAATDITTTHKKRYIVHTFRSLWQRLTPLYDDAEAKSIVRLVLETRFGLSYTDIVCGAAEQLSADKNVTLEADMQQLETGMPVQYVLGQATFCGRSFRVEPGVLIPRPETETLCRLIAADWNRPYCALQPPAPTTVLDIGTGSGCIAVTLALDVDHAAVTAWDISPDALLTARRNAHEWRAEINLELQDALNPPHDDRQWDIIVSNPPYIAEHERADMAPNVLDHEPETALFVPDDDPLRFYRAIAAYAARTLKPDGTLYFEINPLYADSMMDMLRGHRFSQVTILDDQFSRQRICRAQR